MKQVLDGQRRPAAAMIVLIVILAAGCSGSSTRARPTAPALSAFADLVTPVKGIALAEAELVRRCLVQAGFLAAPRPPTRSPTETLLGLPQELSLEEASKNGYGPSVNRTSSNSEGSLDSYLSGLPDSRKDQFSQVLSGDQDEIRVALSSDVVVSASSHGCYAQMRWQLYGSVENYLTVFYLPQGAISALDDLPSHEIVAEAQRQYVSCMAERNIDVHDWNDALKQAQELYVRNPGVTEEPRSEEIRIARADAMCRNRSGLVQAYAEATVREASDWIGNHEQDILAAAEIQRRAAERAVEALGP